METNYEFPVTKVKKTRIWGRDKEWPYERGEKLTFVGHSSTYLLFQCRKVERQCVCEQGQGPRFLLRDRSVVKP